VMLVIAVFLIVAVSLSGWLFGRHSLQKFRALKDPTITWVFTENTIGARSDLGSYEVAWRLYTHIWHFPDAWILFTHKWGWGGYTLLPTRNLTGEVQDFVLERLKANGAKIK